MLLSTILLATAFGLARAVDSAAAAAAASVAAPAPSPRLTFSVSSSSVLPNPASLPPTTHATLQRQGAVLSVPLSGGASPVFVFPASGLLPGSYLFRVYSLDYNFEPLRVDVEPATGTAPGQLKIRAWQTFPGNAWDNKGELRADGSLAGPGNLDVAVWPQSGKNYYQPRTEFSPMSLLKNPMILIAIVSLGLVVGVPYLLENMDPETRAEFEKMQAENKSAKTPSATAAASQLQNFDMAAWLAGRSGGQQPSPAPSTNRPDAGGKRKR